MELTKYKIKASGIEGYLLVIYNDNHFKSCLNEFKKPLDETQLSYLLKRIPENSAALPQLFAPAGDKITVERIKQIGEEIEPVDPQAASFETKDKIALWCNHYAANHKDGDGNPVKYKTGPAEAGKLKNLVVTPLELESLLVIYFESNEWFLKPKSISNFIKKFNEVRAIAYAKPLPKKFPLPYSEAYFNDLDLMGKRNYHAFLKANGYEYQHSAVHGVKWVLKQQ